MLFLGSIKQLLLQLGQSLLLQLKHWSKPGNQTLLSGAITDITRNKQALILENALLRQQLIILNRQVKRPQFNWRDRALIVMVSSRLTDWKQALLVIKPDTVLRWHRDLFRLVWRRRSRMKRIPGRPRLGSNQVALIRRIAAENISWGTERIRGELLKLGLPSAKSTIQHYLKHRRAVKPGNQTWHTFLRLLSFRFACVKWATS